MAVTVNATECWDLPALEEIRLASGMAAVHAALAAGDVGPGAHLARLPGPMDSSNSADSGDSRDSGDGTRPVVFANGFTLSPYAETGGPGGNLKHPPRTLWHASPGSTASPDACARRTPPE
jgi:error-prone DNA polymerase